MGTVATSLMREYGDGVDICMENMITFLDVLSLGIDEKS